MIMVIDGDGGVYILSVVFNMLQLYDSSWKRTKRSSWWIFVLDLSPRSLAR